jgi:hypothetical protein
MTSPCDIWANAASITGRHERHAKFWHHAKRAARWLRNESNNIIFSKLGSSFVLALALVRGMRIGALDRNKALSADGLLAAAGLVYRCRVVHKTNGTLKHVFVCKKLMRYSTTVGLSSDGRVP